MDDYNSYEWENEYREEPGLRMLDEWFASGTWKGICKDANDGDNDSLELMENVSTRLCSLIFQLENNSPRHRIDYEINELKLFIDKFN
jgi:hypothetical protein